MRRALTLASSSDDAEVPVGAVLLGPGGAELAAAANSRVAGADPTAHAEVLALRAAAKALGTWRLSDTTLVVTLEPCAMCAGALVLARVARVVFGADNREMGAAGTVWDLLRDPRAMWRPEVVPGVLAPECGEVLAEFFRRRR